MDIQVEGSNNRVAGRDYYENQIKPCPKCEQRVIDRDKSICNHCTKEERAQLAHGVMLVLGICVLYVFSWLHDWRTERGLPSGLEGLVETFGLAIGIVMAAASILWFFLPLVWEIVRASFDSRHR